MREEPRFRASADGEEPRFRASADGGGAMI